MSKMDDTYLVMCKQAGLKDDIIAARLNQDVAWVKQRWAELQAQAERINSNGYIDLIRQFTIMANQYQLVGESLKALAVGLEKTVDDTELKEIGCPPALAKRLLESFIILHQFVPIDPEAAFEARVASS